MPYARRTSFLSDVKDAWEEAKKERAEKGKNPASKDDLMRFAEDLAALAGMFWVRRNLRRKGAPEWVAYAVSTVDLTLTQIAMNLRRIEAARRKQVEDPFEVEWRKDG